MARARAAVLATATAAIGDASDPAQLEFRLVNFADAIYGEILGLDDVLTGSATRHPPPRRPVLLADEAVASPAE
jgi:hypothetical protein